MTLSIRPLRAEDYPADQLFYTVRGFGLWIDEDLEGIAGVMYSTPMQAFSKLSTRIKREYPIGVFKAGKRLCEIMDEIGCPIYAVADEDEPTSMAFLERLGFELVDERTYRYASDPVRADGSEHSSQRTGCSERG